MMIPVEDNRMSKSDMVYDAEKDHGTITNTKKDPSKRNTLEYVTSDPDVALVVRYHKTDVFTLHINRTATLNTGGYKTVTTKRRINEYLRKFGFKAGIYQNKFKWYVNGVPFYDGMVINREGDVQ